MIGRHLALVPLLWVLGCSSAHEGPSDGDTWTPVGRDDAGSDPDAGDAAPACAVGCDDPGLVCDHTSGACVECVTDLDCGGEGSVCDESNCVGGASADAGVPPDDGGAPTTTFVIRFATYNVRTSNLNNSAWGDDHVGWDSNDEARMHRVADEIASQNLTVVATQEMRRPERDAVLRRLRDHHDQAWRATTQLAGADDTIVLFRESAWRQIRETHFSIPMQSPLRDRNQIGVLLEHDRTGRRVWFYSVHFAAGGSAGAAAREEAARRTVRSIRNHAIENDLPFVLGGDFNTTAASPVGTILRDTGFALYTRAAASRLVNNGCKTFNPNAGSAGRQSCPGGTATHIDHVWVIRSGMDVDTYRVTATARTSRASDHNPLTTILRLD